jgi:phasin family protein
MDLLQTTPGFPFAVPKGWAPFALPRADIEVLFEAYRKNAVAVTSANQIALEGLQSLAQRQGELLSSTVDHCSTVAKEVLAAPSFAERATRQADATGEVYRSAVARFIELYDIATRANVRAVDILSARLTEGLQEFGALLAAPSGSASTAAAPAAAVADAVVASAAAVAEGEAAMRSAVADAADEAEATIAPATPPVAEPDLKPSRRPSRR